MVSKGSKKKPVLPVVIDDQGPALDFRKAHEAIFIKPISGRLTLLKRKGYNVLLKNAQDQGPEQDYFRIPLARFINLLEYDSNDYELVKNLGRSYVATQVEWDALSDQGKRKRWGVAALLSSFEISENTIEYSFDRKIKQRLLDPDIYYRMNLRLQALFRSAYALALYEICGRYLTNPSHVTPRKPWVEWRTLLCGDEDRLYDEFKYFNARVLKRAIEEINTVSDISVELLVTREGKSVSELQFKVRAKAQQRLELEDPNILNSEVYKRMLALGVPPNEAQDAISNYDEGLIEATLVATGKRQSAKGAEPLTSPAAYFLSSLKRGYQRPAAGMLKDNRERQNKKQKVDGRTKLIEACNRARTAQARSYFGELSDDKQSDLLEKFGTSIADNKAVRDVFRKRGLRDKMISGAFFIWLAEDTWGVVTDKDLLQFAINNASLLENAGS